MTRSCSIANSSWLYARIASSAVTCRARCTSCSPADARDARRLERLAQLEAEERLPDVCRRREGVGRNRRQRVAELRRKLVEVRAVQAAPGSRERTAKRVPGDVGQRIGFRFDDAPFEKRDLLEAQLDRGVRRQRLRHRVGARQRLRRCDAGRTTGCYATKMSAVLITLPVIPIR